MRMCCFQRKNNSFFFKPGYTFHLSVGNKIDNIVLRRGEDWGRTPPDGGIENDSCLLRAPPLPIKASSPLKEIWDLTFTALPGSLNLGDSPQQRWRRKCWRAATTQSRCLTFKLRVGEPGGEIGFGGSPFQPHLPGVPWHVPSPR